MPVTRPAYAADGMDVCRYDFSDSAGEEVPYDDAAVVASDGQ